MEVRNNTNNNKGVVDVSSFFLFEATGDSEAAGACFDPVPINADQDDDDDAESCSWDTRSDFLQEVNRLEDRCPDINVGDDEDEDEDEEDEGEVVDQEVYKKCRNDIDGYISKSKLEKKKSSISVDSTKTKTKTMNEMEKNKLFWEACLAS